MNRKVLWVVPVLLVLGFIMAGCSVPNAPMADSSALKSRDLINVNGVNIDTDQVYSYTTSGWNQVVTDISGQANTQDFLMKDSAGNIVATAWCGNLIIGAGSYYKLTTISPAALYGAEAANKLGPALTYIYNYYGNMRENSPLSYNALIQGVIWNITNGATITRMNGNGFLGDNAWMISQNGLVINAITDVLANYDKLVSDYDNGVTMEGTGTANGDMYGPYNVSVNSLFPDMLYDLSSDNASVTFQDTDGNAISQIAADVQFYVVIPAGISGDINFTANAAADKDYMVVNNILVWLEAYTDTAASAANPAYQPLFQPLFQPLLTMDTKNYLYSCSGKINVTPKGNITIVKTVDGVNIMAWASVKGKTVGGLIGSFNLYSVSGDGAEIRGNAIQSANVDEQGVLKFTGLADGWYAIQEVLTTAGQAIFIQAPPVYIKILDGKQVNYVSAFDYSALYTIGNGYGGGYVLGYPGLNNTGDIFPITVTNAATNARYNSFCGHAGSHNFDEGPDAYMIAQRMDRGSALYGDFVSAYNYIADRYGDLNDVRPVTQIVTWYLLGAIDIPSSAFDSINWAAVEAGTGTVKAVPKARAMAEDVIANYRNYTGSGKVADVIYMVSKNNPDYLAAQPQYIPIYSLGQTFNNKVPNHPPPPPPPRPVSAVYSSVTATNAGQVPTIIKGLNPKNGNPFYGDKKNDDTPYVVPNSNHFVFAEFTKAELEAGAALDLVVGNKYNIVGHATVTLIDGKIVIDVQNKAAGLIGAIAFTSKPVFKNGNIHSQKAADLAKFGAVTGFNHDNKYVIPCPAGNNIYLYIHFDSLQFYL